MVRRDGRRALGAGARRKAAGSALGVALVLASSPALANGRFPRAQRLIQDGQNPDLMALYGTYGLLVTRDGGASWRHVCEAATGTYAGEDSLLEIMDGERIVLRTDTGLARSDASLCGYDVVLGSASEALQDITRDSANPNGLLALSTTLGDDGVFVSSLSASADGGETFTPLGSIPPNVLELGLTLDVAANQPALIYLSGFDDAGRGTLVKSVDRGQSFEGFPISGLGVAAPPYIAAVSAQNPDRVFVRTDEFQRANDFEARETANDSLYFTPDGGQTWHRVLNERGKLFGFALSPDERWVLAGYGDPVVISTFVEPSELGLYRVAFDALVASPDAPPWERIYDRGVTCLRWTEQALFACVSQDENGFEVGRASDADFSLSDTQPFQPLLRLPEVRPLECAANSAGAACLTAPENGWPLTCTVLRAPCSPSGSGGAPEPGEAGASAGGADPTRPQMDPASSGMGGASSASSDAGANSDTGSSPTEPSSGAAPRRSSGSCALETRSSEAAYSSVAGWLCASLLLALRRRPSRGSAKALLSALLALVGFTLGGCSDEADPSSMSPSAGEEDEGGAHSAPANCAGEGEDFVLGMSKATASGALTVTIEAAEPAPPLAGPNAWTILLSAADGEPVSGAGVTVTGWMPEHRHGLNAVPITNELDGGQYQIQPIILYMPQLWEIGVVVTQAGERDVATFSFCVP